MHFLNYFNTSEVKKALSKSILDLETRREKEIVNTYIGLKTLYGENANISFTDICDVLNQQSKNSLPF